jgi:flavin reductase (DIM6/NTAB) family NADH-FMN oxidoreductase RutF
VDFKESKPELLRDNPFKLIGTDWMLITAGTPDSFNTMTASWGGMGVLWQKQVCFCFIRPTRYTYEFVERARHFTLSFFYAHYRNVLEFCGSHSGRDTEKVKESNLTPVKKDECVYFAEARLVLVCKKLYFQDINPDHFLDPQIDSLYPVKDYHRMYVGEIITCLTKKS